MMWSEEEGHLLPTWAWKCFANVLTECSSCRQAESEDVWTDRYSFTLALMTAATFSWNIDKIFSSRTQLVPDNLPLQITACGMFYWASILQVTNTRVRRPRYELYSIFISTFFFLPQPTILVPTSNVRQAKYVWTVRSLVHPASADH